MLQFSKDKLNVKILDSRDEMGMTAAKDIAVTIRELQKFNKEINIIFAAAPSQNETLKHLINEPEILWENINAFHMDEYIGLPKSSPACFGNYLDEHIFKIVPFKSVNYINPETDNIETECDRYSSLLKEHPTDIVILGVGENGHIAFNDPGVANFNDSKLVKIAELDETCRNQQVNDGCFAKLDDVPKYALTLTIPALTNAKYMFCSVPAITKAWAVNEMLTTEIIDEHCPATILRLHDNATLYCDKDSSSLLKL